MDKIKCEFFSWERIYRQSRELSEAIRKSGFRPDIIIGLARGGWVPSRNLCDFLGIKDLISLKAEHWGVTASKDGKAKLKYKVSVDLTGKNVLIADDCADTGESLNISKEFVKTLNPKDVKTCTLYAFDTTPRNRLPDFCAEELPWTWVIYPWNITEDVVNLVGKLLDSFEKMHLENIIHGFEEHFGLKIEKDFLGQIMKECEHREKAKRIDGKIVHWAKHSKE